MMGGASIGVESVGGAPIKTSAAVTGCEGLCWGKVVGGAPPWGKGVAVGWAPARGKGVAVGGAPA